MSLRNSSIPGHVKHPESTSLGSRVWLGKNTHFRRAKGFSLSQKILQAEQEHTSLDPFYQFFLTSTHVSLRRADEKRKPDLSRMTHLTGQNNLEPLIVRNN